MDTFKITGYNQTTQTVTVDFVLVARANFAGGTFLGVKIQNPPTDTVENVKAFFRLYADGYIKGVVADNLKTKAIDPSVAALVNIVTNF